MLFAGGDNAAKAGRENCCVPRPEGRGNMRQAPVDSYDCLSLEDSFVEQFMIVCHLY